MEKTDINPKKVTEAFNQLCQETLEEESQRLKKMPYEDFLKTDYWHTVSAYVKLRDNYECCHCGSSQNLRTHHRNYKKHGYEHQFHETNLITLCNECHQKVHEAKIIRKLSYAKRKDNKELQIKSNRNERVLDMIKEQIANDIQAYLNKNPSIEIPKSLNKLLKTKNRTLDRFFRAAMKIDIKIGVTITYPSEESESGCDEEVEANAG